jgi:hypothetical protein
MSEEMIVKYLLNECDAAAKAEVEDWIQSSLENATVYDQYKKYGNSVKYYNIFHQKIQKFLGKN